MPGARGNVLRAIVGKGQPIKQYKIEQATSMSYRTVLRAVEDLQAIGLVDMTKVGDEKYWHPADEFRSLLEEVVQ
jgi:uncharacterized membrane protein